MKSTTLLASIAILAAAISTPLVARDREHDSQRDRQYVTDKRAKDGFDHGMQEVHGEVRQDDAQGREEDGPHDERDVRFLDRIEEWHAELFGHLSCEIIFRKLIGIHRHQLERRPGPAILLPAIEDLPNQHVSVRFGPVDREHRRHGFHRVGRLRRSRRRDDDPRQRGRAEFETIASIEVAHGICIRKAGGQEDRFTTVCYHQTRRCGIAFKIRMPRIVHFADWGAVFHCDRTGETLQSTCEIGKFFL